ncbi:MAG: bifunctional diaminohydroxyphosphoribosylaminopyrimidine deaminase/5-amino-6-(5-phosphoribosylamino)uracil reductase RibD [Planctomycetes bacterium]|nr:bifunctional diaminohydroxyphosphoribosylaminopyrimidine deaminase/5-amino-6-(5-phosphoribosylamino)uracil reductase RibD [Planctomycetota bacterium]
MGVDEEFMRRALTLARQGKGRVEPNPMVGAVVVREGAVVGEGWHERFGGLHAEPNALAAAGEKSRGATLYVNLEPCAHFGKTPPCSDVILKAGIAKVVFATRDPNPVTAGKGPAMLRAAGVEVVEGVLEAEARKLNAPFFKLITTGRPFVILKWAMTLDGKIATRTGESKWITSAEARAHVHKVRREVDAVLVGIGTVLADDPELTCRLPEGGRNPKRVVLDSRARIPMTAKLVKTARQAEVIVATTSDASAAKIGDLRHAGCSVIVADGPGGKVDLGALLTELGRRQMTSVLVEGGAEVIGAFLDAKLADHVMAFIAPILVGDAQAKPPAVGRPISSLADALRLTDVQVARFGDDLLIEGSL